MPLVQSGNTLAPCARITTSLAHTSWTRHSAALAGVLWLAAALFLLAAVVARAALAR